MEENSPQDKISGLLNLTLEESYQFRTSPQTKSSDLQFKPSPLKFGKVSNSAVIKPSQNSLDKTFAESMFSKRATEQLKITPFGKDIKDVKSLAKKAAEKQKLMLKEMQLRQMTYF